MSVILRSLHAHDVDFVIVGGVALIANGSKRVTRDLDICYRRSPENIVRLNRALAPLKPSLRWAPPGFPFVFNTYSLKSGLNFTLITNAGNLDLLGEIAGVGRYEDALRDARQIYLVGKPTNVLSLNTLARSKRAAGRVKDLVDLAEISRLKKEELMATNRFIPTIRFGQRDIGFPISPVQRRFTVPQAIPNGPVVQESRTVLRTEQINPLQAAVVSPVERLSASPGYFGPGPYRALMGLRIFPEPVFENSAVRAEVVDRNDTVQVVRDAGGGWFEIVRPVPAYTGVKKGQNEQLQKEFYPDNLGTPGFVCASCPQMLGQPQLVPLFSNYANPVDRGRLEANRINRPIGPSIRGIGQLLNPFAPAINMLMPAKLRRPVTRYIAPYRPGNEFVNRPNVSLGYEGPGTYLVVARNGLNIRPGPSSNSGYSLGVIPFESTIQVVGDAGDGWLQVVNVIGRRVMGYMCISCAEAPGGPWLVLLDRSRDDVLNPNGAVG